MNWLGVGRLGTSPCPVKSPLAGGLCPTRKCREDSHGCMTVKSCLAGLPLCQEASWLSICSGVREERRDGVSTAVPVGGVATFAETSLETGDLGELGAGRMKLQMRAEGLGRGLGDLQEKGGRMTEGSFKASSDNATLKLHFSIGSVVSFIFFMLQNKLFYREAGSP